MIGYSNALPGGTGDAPTLPAAACRFSGWIAVMTSVGAIRWLAIRSGSSQIRIAYFRPNGVDVAHARDPLEDVDDVDLAVVVEEGRVVPAVGRDEVDDADHVGRRLLDRDAELLDLGRQARLRRLHLVLDVDRGDVLRVADLEGRDDLETPLLVLSEEK